MGAVSHGRECIKQRACVVDGNDSLGSRDARSLADVVGMCAWSHAACERDRRAFTESRLSVEDVECDVFELLALRVGDRKELVKCFGKGASSLDGHDADRLMNVGVALHDVR